MLNIVCFMGGTAGDLVTALLDSSGVIVSPFSAEVPAMRTQLKKPHLFRSNDEKDILVAIANTSISSHDYAYHLDRQHKILCVVVTDLESALWAATRFKELHRDHVWAEMSAKCGATTITEYAQMYIDFSIAVKENPNALIIDLKDLLSGNLLNCIKELNIPLADNAAELYNIWLNKEKTK
jgi:hypothetical protein